MSVPDVLTPNQRRTLPARRALAAKFATAEERSQHYRAMAERANAGRVVLSAEQAAALAEAYTVLRTVADRLPDPTPA